jgi:hypothetical protein
VSIETNTNRVYYLIIHEIILNNFLSYYGKHVLKLKAGVNYIIGSCGSRRTNLVRAFQFAVLGYCDIPKRTLFNYFHIEDMREKNKTAFCEVETKLLHQDRVYVCKSSMHLDIEGRIKQKTTISEEIDKIINSKDFEFIYLNSLKMKYREEDTNESGSIRIWNAVLEYLAENMRLYIRLAILDQVMDHFDHATTERMQNCISRLPFEQIIVIDNGARERPNQNPHNIVMVQDQKGSSIISYPKDCNENKQKVTKSSVFKVPTDGYIGFEDSPKLLEYEIQKIEKAIAEFYARIQKTQSIINKYYAQKDIARANLYCCNLAEKITILKTSVKAHLYLSKTVHLLYLSLVRSRLSINLPISIELIRIVRSLIHCLLPEVENQLENVEKIIEKKMSEFAEFYSIINQQDVHSRVEKILEMIDKEADEQIKTKFPINITKS